jgi:ankyrin repeat protein
MVKFILSLTEDVSFRDHDDNTSLHLVTVQKPHSVEAAGDVAEVIHPLVSRGIDVNARNRWGKAPIHYAARCGNKVEALKALIANGAEVDTTYSRGAVLWTPLKLAGIGSTVEVLLVLINSGANILFNSRGKENNELLYRAAEAGWDKVFKRIAMWRHHRRLKECKTCTKKIKELMDKSELPLDLLA